jgi:hypothetical protein
LFLGIAVVGRVGVSSDGLWFLGLGVVLLASTLGGILTARLFASEFEITGEYQYILHPNRLQPEQEDDGEGDLESRPNAAEPDEDAGERVLDDGPRRKEPVRVKVRTLLGLSDERPTLEGVALRVAYVLLVVGAVYMTLEPVIFRVWPTFRATKHGPPGFPVTAVIGENGIAVSNRSSVSWLCYLTIRDVFHASATVSPGETKPIDYRLFSRRPDTRAVDQPLQSAARRNLTVACREPSGAWHWTRW